MATGIVMIMRSLQLTSGVVRQMRPIRGLMLTGMVMGMRTIMDMRMTMGTGMNMAMDTGMHMTMGTGTLMTMGMGMLITMNPQHTSGAKKPIQLMLRLRGKPTPSPHQPSQATSG